MVNYSKTTLQKEGVLKDGGTTYEVSVTIVNNELTRLHCSITKKIVVNEKDHLGNEMPMDQDHHVGHIAMEYGRVITETIQGENLMPHLNKFQQILDELLAKK